MSANLNATVDRIITDRDFAQRVYEDPESTLADECGLDNDEVRAVHAALAADVAEAQDEVAGFASVGFGGIPLPNLTSLASAPRDLASGQASGRRQWAPVKIVKEG